MNFFSDQMAFQRLLREQLPPTSNDRKQSDISNRKLFQPNVGTNHRR